MDKAETTTDEKKRQAIFSDIQKILARDLPYVSLWHEHNIAILKRGVEGYFVTPNARFGALTQTHPPEGMTDGTDRKASQ
ncbi:MAG: hypothetical protein ABEN55_11710 [Bradymonadaceae bacterium]